MILSVLVILFIFCLTPIEIINLNRGLSTIDFYNNRFYFAPRIGKSIFELTESHDLRTICFTDDVNYKIYDFKVTPFAFYLNNGKSIEKFYVASGKKENVFTSNDISSFIVTPAEDIIFADRLSQEIVFLDFKHRIKFKIPDIRILDLHWFDGIIYALTTNGIITYDEFGNRIGEKNIPVRFDKIFVDSMHIFLFSKNGKYFYILNETLERIDFQYGISDIYVNDESIIILDGSGTNLYFLNRREF